MGYEKNVVIMTRNKGYRSKEKDRKTPTFVYKNYPRLRVDLSKRVKTYNEQLEMIEEMEDKGKIWCIRPEKPLEVGRIEKDVQKLERLYEEGFTLGERFCNSLHIISP
jgi:predicted patatin/cPLA2 family phospholipase